MSRVCDVCGYAINKPITWIIGLKIRETTLEVTLSSKSSKKHHSRSPHKTKAWSFLFLGASWGWHSHIYGDQSKIRRSEIMGGVLKSNNKAKKWIIQRWNFIQTSINHVCVLCVLKLKPEKLPVPSKFGSSGRSLPDILACLGVTGSKYIGNSKIGVCKSKT